MEAITSIAQLAVEAKEVVARHEKRIYRTTHIHVMHPTGEEDWLPRSLGDIQESEIEALSQKLYIDVRNFGMAVAMGCAKEEKGGDRNRKILTLCTIEDGKIYKTEIRTDAVGTDENQFVFPGRPSNKKIWAYANNNFRMSDEEEIDFREDFRNMEIVKY